ncbi:MAG: CoA pyrophosphatase [Bacteroidetes bacterium]|nr:CoA pyrophosphatase [Bacteroidota bacterium]
MAPHGRKSFNCSDFSVLNSKKGSILIAIYPHNNLWLTAYIKRTEYTGVHSGQISFPGGKFEPRDISAENTALRETYEEIGVFPEEVEIIGQLSDLYIPASNFIVTPFVGFIPIRPQFKIQEKEVAALIEVELNTILKASENVATTKIRTVSDRVITAPVYQFEQHLIWGATAMITSEFIELVKMTGMKL